MYSTACAFCWSASPAEPGLLPAPLLLLSLLYRAPHWQRLWSALVIYAASFLLDTLVFLLMPAHTSQLETWYPPCSCFYGPGVGKALSLFRKELQPDGPFYWFAVLLIPSTSIAMVILLFYFAHCPAWLSLLVDGMLILLNLLVFHLYRQVGRSYYAQYRARILEQQNQAYANEVALYQCGERELRTLRHDMRNHLAALHLLAGQQDTGALQGYLEQFSKCLEPSALWASSGNPELDSLINFKLAEARRAGAQVRAELRLPAGLSLPLFTVNTILGNLLDNAVEGLARCPQKELSLALWADRGLCRLRVENTFDGTLLQDHEGNFKTRKAGTSLHGMGLDSVRRALSLWTAFTGTD